MTTNQRICGFLVVGIVGLLSANADNYRTEVQLGGGKSNETNLPQPRYAVFELFAGTTSTGSVEAINNVGELFGLKDGLQAPNSWRWKNGVSSIWPADNPRGINDSGDIVAQGPTVWKDESVVRQYDPPAFEASMDQTGTNRNHYHLVEVLSANAINSAGTVAGYAHGNCFNLDNPQLEDQDIQRAVLWWPNNTFSMLRPGIEDTLTWRNYGAFAINDSGAAVGCSWDILTPTQTEAVYWATSTSPVVSLGTGAASDINVRGRIVGRSEGKAVLWENGQKTILGAGAASRINSPSEAEKDVIIGGVDGIGPVLWQLEGENDPKWTDHDFTTMVSSQWKISVVNTINAKGVIGGRAIKVKNNDGTPILPENQTATAVLLIPFQIISDLNNNGKIDNEDWTLKSDGEKPDASDKEKENATEYLFANNKISNGLPDPEDTKLTDHSKKNEDDIQELNTACAATWGAVWFDHPAIEKMSFYRTKECKQTTDDKLSFPFALSSLPAGKFPDKIYARLDGDNFTEQAAGDLIMRFGKSDKSETWASDKLKLTVVKDVGDSKYFHAARDYIMENNTLFYTDEKSYGGELMRVTIMRQEAAKMQALETYYREPKIYGIAGVAAAMRDQTLVVNGNFVYPFNPSDPQPLMTKRCNGRLITGGALHTQVSTDSTQAPANRAARDFLCGPDAKYVAQLPNGAFRFGYGEVPLNAGYSEALGGLNTNYTGQEKSAVNIIGQIVINPGNEKKLIFSAQSDPRVSPDGEGSGTVGFVSDIKNATGTGQELFILDGGSSVAMAYADPNAKPTDSLTVLYGGIKHPEYRWFGLYVNTYLMFKCTRPRTP